MNTKSLIRHHQFKVADQVWVATALLHRERPDAADFTLQEIVERAARETPGETLRPGVYVHVAQHCVANRAPNPGRYRMLLETSEGRRRLYREGDPSHPNRAGAKTRPDPGDLPPEYASLLEWYAAWSRESRIRQAENDPLLAARGSGRHLWSPEAIDDYVRELREGWE